MPLTTMLRSLDIRDMLIIDRLELEFEAGLNVLTGETGAGKSILLDCLGFVLGWRGRAELVREGAAQGEVTASFDLPAGHPGLAILAEARLEDEGELVLRRVNSRDGRKTAWINGRRAPGEVLRQLSETLVELHGQHDDRGLLNPGGHRHMLDAFAGVDAELAECKACWKALDAAKKALAATQKRIDEAKEEEDFLRHAVEELDKLNPEPGEEATLDSKRRLMQAAERIRSDIARASEALGLQGAEGQIGDASRWLGAVAEDTEGKLDGALEAIERVLSELYAAQSGVEDCLEALAFNPNELEDAEERLFAIRGLARKHNVLPDELGNFAIGLRQRLAVLDDGAGHLKVQEEAVGNAHKAYDAAARALQARRVAAASGLDRAMGEELAPLKMERAVFETQISDATPGPEGCDDVAFRVATNPGAPSGPLNKIASGGELSRFLLALKVCLSKDAASERTMIFDEIDRGVGGATADAVGKRLAELASDGQILVVTHSPQVAALGQHHWRVEKRQDDDTTVSTVIALDPNARIDEIARMLSGDTITDVARAAAKSLIVG